MTTSSIFNIGLSGLAAAQANLLTAGHNISNANTPNFSRQEVLLASRTPLSTGGSFVGRGVDVTTVRRVYDQYLTVQLRQSQAHSSQLDAYKSELNKVDNALGDSASNLSPVLDQFFAAINTVAANPADLAARQVALSTAQGLVGRFHSLDARLNESRASINQQVVSTVGAINATSAEIAALNQQIAEASARADGAQPPNDLLDHRDALLASLSQQIGATAVAQSDGTWNVFLSNGQALVVGEQAYTLNAVPDPRDPRNIQIGLQAGATTVGFTTADLTGGSLSGLLQARDNVLANAQNSLGRIAAVLAKAFNDQHALGVNLSGAPGGAFFAPPTPEVQEAQTNTGTAAISVALTNASALTSSDYRLSYDGASYSLTRISDNTVSTFATLPQTVDGLTITLNSGAPAAGDSFFIQPTRDAAGQLGVALTNPADIALAAPILTSTPATNTGSGRISAGSVDSAYLASPLSGTVTLTYNSGAGTLTGFPAALPVTVTVGGVSTTYAAGAPVPYTPDATIAFGGIQFVISGSPANGDTFAVAPNPTGVGDNRNAVLLAGLSSQNTVGGNSTLHGTYAQLVGQIGSTTQQAQILSDAAAQTLSQTQQAQQQVSGVNLDEEAANLLRYQQMYEASSKVIAIAATLFDSILAIASAAST